MEVKMRYNCNPKNIKGCNCFHFPGLLSCFICIGCCLYVIYISNEIKYLRNELSAISETCSQKKSIDADEKEWTPIRSRYGVNVKEYSRRMRRNADGIRNHLWNNNLFMADKGKDTDDINNRHRHQNSDRKKSSLKGHRKKGKGSKRRRKGCKKYCAKLRKNKREKSNKDLAFDAGTIRDIVTKEIAKINNSSIEYSRNVMWSHFTSNFWSDFTEEMFDEHTGCITIWSGRVCTDRSYKNTYKHQLIYALKESNSTFGYSSAVETRDGQYRILYNGLYLLYLHATYWKVSENDVFALTHRRHQDGKATTVLRCRQSNNDTFPLNDLNRIFSSCSLTNVLYMWKNDIVDFRLVEKNTILDLSEDSTYFGIVKII